MSAIKQNDVQSYMNSLQGDYENEYFYGYDGDNITTQYNTPIIIQNEWVQTGYNGGGAIRTGIGAFGGVSGMTHLSAQLSGETQFKYGKRVNGIVKSAKAITQENAMIMGKIVSGAKFVGTSLGVVSLLDHSAQAINSFNEGDNLNGWINVGKASLDIGLIFFKSNPYVLGVSIIYNISDAAGLLNFKR